MPRIPEIAFDDTDVAILEILQRDGRAPFSVIARQLELPETTVRQRCRRIFDSGLVSIVATGDPLLWGIPVDAIHLVRVDPVHLDATAHALEAMPEVRYVGIALGGGTLIVESLHPSAEDLHVFLVQRVPALTGVKEVNTHQIVEIRTSVWNWRTWLQGGKLAPGPSAGTPSREATEERPEETS